MASLRAILPTLNFASSLVLVCGSMPLLGQSLQRSVSASIPKAILTGWVLSPKPFNVS